MKSLYPLAYLITFCCYGTRLHGALSAVTKYINEFGAPTLPPDLELWEQTRKRLKQRPYKMDRKRRRIVLQALVEVCKYEGWIRGRAKLAIS